VWSLLAHRRLRRALKIVMRLELRLSLIAMALFCLEAQADDAVKILFCTTKIALQHKKSLASQKLLGITIIA
jgi:hypothetical protein